jgi:hypothetical protein
MLSFDKKRKRDTNYTNLHKLYREIVCEIRFNLHFEFVLISVIRVKFLLVPNSYKKSCHEP